MQPVDIQTLATQACFSTVYEIKSKAEQQYLALVRTLNSQQLQQLMSKYSETVLFVTMEQLYKVIPTMQSPVRKDVFTTLNAVVETWFNHGKKGGLVRNGPNNNNRVGLAFHVQNSVARTLGQCLKWLYLQRQYQDWIAQFIKTRSNLRYQLFIWKIFIQTVAVVDSQLSFLIYRSLVYGFQQNIIPLIMDSLLPFFQSVREQIQINDLAQMQSHLTVGERSMSNGLNGQNSQQNGYNDIYLFNDQDVKFTELVFQVLKQVICFNYNITYSEFESQQPIDNCLVCFPDQVTKKIAHRDFIASMFYVAEKLINDSPSPNSNHKNNQNNNSHTQKFLPITLECLQKIMLTKLFYTSSQLQQNFIKTVLVSMCRLLTLALIKLDQKIITSLLQANTKFLINIEIYKLKNYEQEYNNWLAKVVEVARKVIMGSFIYLDNIMLTNAIELIAKIVDEALMPQLKPQLSNFKKLGVQIGQLVVEKLFTQNTSILGVGSGQKIRSFQQLKKNIGQFFKRIKQLFCLSLGDNLSRVEPYILKILQDNQMQAISNVFFFFSQCCESTTLGRTMLYQIQDQKSCNYFGKFIVLLLQFLSTYQSSPISPPPQLLQSSFLIFTEHLLGELLNSYSYDPPIAKLSSQLYRSLHENQPSLTAQELLTYLFNSLTISITPLAQFNRVSYTFEVLSTLLLKFKWASKRQYFRQTLIAKNVLKYCEVIDRNGELGQSGGFDSMDRIVLRKQLFRIITNISFDDTLDDYRNNINKIVAMLQQNMYTNKWRVLYDLTGICQSIDTSAIYRYFMISLQKSKIAIPIVMKELFQGAIAIQNQQVKIELLKDILKLQLSMIENKGQRLTGSKNIFYNYKLLSFLMPYWAQMLKLPAIASQSYDELLLQLYKIFHTLLKNNNTNFYILERTIPEYKSFFFYFLKNMLEISKWIQQYPSLFEQHKNCLSTISKQLLQPIFCTTQEELLQIFHSLLNITLEFTLRQLAKLANGNRNIEDPLETTLETIKCIYKYIRNARKLEHKIVQIKNLKIIEQVEGQWQKICIFLGGLLKYGIGAGKRAPRIIDLICKIIYYMDYITNEMKVKIIKELGVGNLQSPGSSQPHSLDNMRNNQSITLGEDLLNFWTQCSNLEQMEQYCSQNDGSQFVSKLKDWFKKCNSVTMSQPEY